MPSDKSEIEEYLKIKFGKKILISIPARGSKKEVIGFVSRNLKNGLSIEKIDSMIMKKHPLNLF